MSPVSRYILFVDDDEDDRDLILRCCEQLNKAEKARFLASGEELLRFLATLQSPEDYPALIVLDINMPGMGGETALLRLKAEPRYQHIPVIVYSTGDNSNNHYTGIGAEAFCQKPFSLEQWEQKTKAFFERLPPQQD